MDTKLITNDFKSHLFYQLQESIYEKDKSTYYLFVSNHIDREDSTVPSIEHSPRSVTIDTYRNMLFGKKVSGDDLSMVIRYIPYESNKIYDMYDDSDEFLHEKDFYCVVNAISYHHVFKCLDNNRGALSTVEPDFDHINGANSYLYRTSDGYVWKYLYSVSDSDNSKFKTSEFFPVSANAQVSLGATVGSIDVIKINDVGKGYDNYLTGTFSLPDLRVNGNTQIYAISSNSIASTTNSFYTDCLMYLSGGTGSGQYRKVIDYVVNESGKFARIYPAFDIPPTNGTTYEIYPMVEIIGTGSETVNAVARALVNTNSSNSIYRVEILERGLNYDFATANVLSHEVVGVHKPASLQVIHSPPKGHGRNPISELYSNAAELSISLSNSESNTIPTTNKFQQFGIIKDPSFSDVELEFSEIAGAFTYNEIASIVSPVKLNSNITLTSFQTNVTCDNCGFDEQLSPGTIVFFKASNNSAHQLGIVNSVTNSSLFSLTSNGLFSCTEVTMYQANISSNCVVSDLVTPTRIKTTHVYGNFSTGDILVGFNSGAKATVNSIYINDKEKDLSTFIQMYKYECNVISGSFLENELVYQDNVSTSNAYLHSIELVNDKKYFYVSNQSGVFNYGGGNTIIGSNSDSIATVINKYNPELIFGSGEILYLENIDPVDKDNSNTVFKIIIEI